MNNGLILQYFLADRRVSLRPQEEAVVIVFSPECMVNLRTYVNMSLDKQYRKLYNWTSCWLNNEKIITMKPLFWNKNRYLETSLSEKEWFVSNRHNFGKC